MHGTDDAVYRVTGRSGWKEQEKGGEIMGKGWEEKQGQVLDTCVNYADLSNS